MLRFAVLSLVLLIMTISVATPGFALSPFEVLVVYNANPDIPSDHLAFDVASRSVADYYASSHGIPSGNLLGLSSAPYTESVPSSWYVSYLATPIWNYLSTHPHIKCIVLCYGIPSRITYQSNYDMSVDAALALLGNPGVPDAQGQFVRHWGLNSTNPYCGKNTDFGKFRDSAENAVQVTVDGQTNTWKLNYLVTRLDAYSQPTVSVNGTAIPRYVKAMIDRSVAAQPDGCFVVDRSGADPKIIHIQNTLTAAHIGATLH